MADTYRRRTRRRRLVALTVAVVVLGGGGGVAWAMTGGSGSGYRLATVQRADVRQTVDADGTLAASDRATVAFAAGGTVSSVDVAVGDTVRAGQVLARLDPTSLDAAVTSAQQALAQAQERLASDEDAQANGATTTSAARTGSSSAAVLLSARTPPAKGTSLRQAQQAVVAAQHQLDAALASAAADLNAVGTGCASAPSLAHAEQQVTADPSGTVSGPVGSTPVVAVLMATGTSSDNPQQVGAGGSFSFAGLTAATAYTVTLVSADTSSCASALTTAQHDQAAVASADRQLAAAIGALTAAASAAGSQQSGTGSGSGTGRATSPSAGTGRTSTGTGSQSGSGTRSGTAGATGTTVTAAQIAADAKAVDAAQAALAVANHDVGYATLTSPIAGTVGAVTITAGSGVSASSSTATITVVGHGAMSIQVDIGLSDIDLVKLGQPAAVTVDGRTAPLAGKVTYVGGTNASSTGSASYPVTIALDVADAKLFDGMGASAAIQVGTATHVLTVPVSAVHTVGRLHTVTVYANGRRSTTLVTLGVQGDDRVQVASGLSAGQQVVIADMGAALPSSSTQGVTRGALNRFTGGGFARSLGGR